ncbi:hypothetical protein MHBO_002837, partial [Bonamia ostreae]
AVARVSDCSHTFCWNCLVVLKDSSESIGYDVKCVPKCTSWLTRDTVQRFLQEYDNSKNHVSFRCPPILPLCGYKLNTTGTPVSKLINVI